MLAERRERDTTQPHLENLFTGDLKESIMLHQLGFKTLTALSALALGTLMIAPATVRSDDNDKGKTPITAKTAFTQLKTMAGTWKNKVSEADEHGHPEDGKVIYRLTGAGSALVETDFPESNHEMVSVYHLDGDDLRMTHYCAAGNQPKLKLDRASSTPTRFVFVFDGGTNLDPAKDMHIHAMTMTFQKEGEVECAWEGYAGGKKAGTTRFQLNRSKP
jgi:hypothetical protein